ncbi:hypothetical protein KJA15_00375 [Patescibacteria group bacterium]|nr:hypothetical protein [Patescibacteria group bacterium]
MEKARLGFVVLFVIGIAVALYSWYSYSNFVAMEYGHISDAIADLQQAKEAQAFEDKIGYVKEAIQHYQQGPNMENLQILATMTTPEQLDISLPEVIKDLENEHSAATLTPRTVIPAFVYLGFLVSAFLPAVFYGRWKKSSDGEKYLTGVIIALLISFLLGALLL